MNPLVSVIVPHHLNENDEYLRLCVKSVLSSDMNHFYLRDGLEVIVISDAACPPIVGDIIRGPELKHGQTYIGHHRRDLNNLTKKWHFGVRQARGKYIMLISDDVMVSKHTIGEMADTIGDNQMILNPSSNCDATTRYHTDFVLWKKSPNGRDGIKIGLKTTVEEISGYEQAIIDYPLFKRILIDPGWVSFYCTMFPRTVLERVGDFDEKLDVRWNDWDYCNRARKLGIPSLINLGVFCLHFGDRSLPKCTSPEEYAAADKAFQAKYCVS